MELKNYYVILGVPQTATARDILRAFRERAKLYHPDRVGPQGTSAFQDIVEAYEVLNDPERRRHYNHTLSEQVDVSLSAPPGGSPWPPPEPLIPAGRHYRLYSQPEPLLPEPMSILHDFGSIHPSFDTLRDHFLQNFLGQMPQKSARMEHLTVEVRLSPYEALQGCIVPVGIPVFGRCGVCYGSGRDWFSWCVACRGQGMSETEEAVHVRIPPGIREGALFDVPLQQWGIANLLLRLRIRVTW